MVLKKLIKKLVDITVRVFVKIFTQIKIGRYFLYKLNNKIINEKKYIEIGNLKLLFYVPNEINRFRVNTFFTKEPETLIWINGFKENATFFDIGLILVYIPVMLQKNFNHRWHRFFLGYHFAKKCLKKI